MIQGQWIFNRDFLMQQSKHFKRHNQGSVDQRLRFDSSIRTYYAAEHTVKEPLLQLSLETSGGNVFENGINRH